MPRWTAPAAVAALVTVLIAGGCGSGPSGQGSATAATEAARGRAFFPNGPRTRAVVWAVGDATASAPSRAVANLVARGRPDSVLYLGDVYPSGTPADFRVNFAPAFGSLAHRTAPTPGNHDWPNRRAGYLSYWQKPRNRPTPAFYSFKAGGWELLSLNSEIGPRPDQMRWLRGRLRAGGTCRLAFWHRPRFSGGLHGDYTPMDPVWRALQGRAAIVLSGHDHDMQRFAPRGGLVQYVSGAGGRSHYAVNRAHPGLLFADDRSWGALRLELTPGSARLEFVSTRGTRLDSSRVACR
jgi:hypothetical protein